MTTTELLLAGRATKDLEVASPVEIVRWAHDRFGGGMVVTASFQDAVMAHVAVTAVPELEIVLIDTGYLFAETLWYAETLRRRLDLNLKIVRPELGPADADGWLDDVEGCCAIRKVRPLRRVLAGRTAWVSGLRRADGPLRSGTPIAGYDAARRVTKVNPLAAMTDVDVDEYHRVHDLPRHPLSGRGYPSIGCWPCTRPVLPGDDARSGRWAGSDKTECGLHR